MKSVENIRPPGRYSHRAISSVRIELRRAENHGAPRRVTMLSPLPEPGEADQSGSAPTPPYPAHARPDFPSESGRVSRRFLGSAGQSVREHLSPARVEPNDETELAAREASRYA